MELNEVKAICGRISAHLLGTKFTLRIERDCKDPVNGRIFIQWTYYAFCTKSRELKDWHGEKRYLSDHMTPDEIVKKAYSALELCVRHELLEGFQVDGKPLFNPHTSFEALLSVSDQEVYRQ